jgi:histidyl-tRNA synthetase
LVKTTSDLNKKDILLEGISELKTVIKCLEVQDIPLKYYEIDLSIARGLGYYTGTVYETFLTDFEKLGSVCSGGRYEDLVGLFRNEKMPGVGISIGWTRLFSILKGRKTISINRKSPAKLVIVPLDESLMSNALNIAKDLRHHDIPNILMMEFKGLNKQLKWADNLSIDYCLILGSEECNQGLVTLKNLQNGQQSRMTLDKCIQLVKTQVKKSTELK